MCCLTSLNAIRCRTIRHFPLVCGLQAEPEIDAFDGLANTYCDCEELTDFKFDNFANNFCNYKELKDFCSDKILQGIGFNREQFKQEQPAKLAEAIPCLDNSEQFSEVVEKELTARFGEINH